MKMDDRWCSTCERDHGPLYVCEHYPDSLKDELLKRGQKLREHIDSWPESPVKTVYQFFAGD